MIVEYFFEPLKKLEIILVLAFDKSFDFDVFHDTELGEVLLEEFEVVDVLVVVFGFEVYFVELDFGWVE